MSTETERYPGQPPAPDELTDLRQRWRPSEGQLKLVADRFAVGPRGRSLYTVHLLVGKHYGWWTTDVRVAAVEGLVFDSREAGLSAAHLAERVAHAALPGMSVTVGWTVHRSSEEWAVFEEPPREE